MTAYKKVLCERVKVTIKAREKNTRHKPELEVSFSFICFTRSACLFESEVRCFHMKLPLTYQLFNISSSLLESSFDQSVPMLWLGYIKILRCLLFLQEETEILRRRQVGSLRKATFPLSSKWTRTFEKEVWNILQFYDLWFLSYKFYEWWKLKEFTREGYSNCIIRKLTGNLRFIWMYFALINAGLV